MENYLDKKAYYRDRMANALGYMQLVVDPDGNFGGLLKDSIVAAKTLFCDFAAGDLEDMDLRPNGYFFHRVFPFSAKGCFAETVHISRKAICEGVLKSTDDLEEFFREVEKKTAEIFSDQDTERIFEKIDELDEGLSFVEWVMYKDEPGFWCPCRKSSVESGPDISRNRRDRAFGLKQ